MGFESACFSFEFLKYVTCVRILIHEVPNHLRSTSASLVYIHTVTSLHGSLHLFVVKDDGLVY